MEDSVTYQAIIWEGQIKEARNILIRQGTRRFQAPSEEVLGRIRTIESLERLESLLDRVLDATSWDDLLGEGSQAGG